MTIYVYIATSTDGYIATDDGGIDWLFEHPNPDQNDYGYTDFIATIDAVVMGRHSFDKVRTFGEWPYTKKVFVLSSRMQKVPQDLEGKIEIISGSPIDVVSDLKRAGFENLYLDGGITIQTFLQNDLIDELIITRIPILLGGGIPLFGELNEPLRFRHKRTDIYDGGLVKTHLVRDR